MRSTFYGLEIARKGLFISQKGLDVTGHNIANANTPGYTRQRLVTSSVEPGVASDGYLRIPAKASRCRGYHTGIIPNSGQVYRHAVSQENTYWESGLPRPKLFST